MPGPERLHVEPMRGTLRKSHRDYEHEAVTRPDANWTCAGWGTPDGRGSPKVFMTAGPYGSKEAALDVREQLARRYPNLIWTIENTSPREMMEGSV